MQTQWLHDLILDGLSQLLCLSLERTPAADMIAGTAAGWCMGLGDLAWDQARDTPRIRQAFATLTRTRTTWPAPIHFREALPRFEQVGIGYEVKPLPPEQAQARLDGIRAQLLRRDAVGGEQ